MRDVLKQAESGRKQIKYNRELTVNELEQLHRLTLDPPNIRKVNGFMTQS